MLGSMTMMISTPIQEYGTVNNPFRKRRKERTNTLLHDMKAQFKELDARFRSLEQSMDRLNGKFPQITIQNLHVHQPVLEKLEFRLDGLDIEHLSGSLNLGNNFGAKVLTERNGSKPGSESKPNGAVPFDEHADLSMPGLHRTSSGFRLNNRR
jgi:TolA-binding protein